MKFFIVFLAIFITVNIPLSQAASVCAMKSCVDVEIVINQEDMRRGLQGRDSLIPGHGMLFVFEEEGLQRFWMKDMRFPIDMIWINEDFTIVAMILSAPSCASGPCEVYSPEDPAKYVLELPAGYATQQNWEIGSKVQFKDVNLK